jgi:LuxR family maltose regulon positive regulatory protein
MPVSAENTRNTVLLRAKLTAAAPRRTVPRPGLVHRLRESTGRLTLVDAPAGWGKTTLLAEWQASPDEHRRFAWLSLDDGDNDPVRFWAYLLESIRAAAPAVGWSASDWLAVTSAEISDTVVPALINDAAGLPAQVVIVLDDYHVVHEPQIHRSIGYLLEHLPPTLHLVLSTRADPPLPIARLRLSGDLVELRARDLRFSGGEAQELLTRVLGIHLSRGDIDRLMERTEGWAAGLCLAALSLAGSPDPTASVARFAGDDRHVVEYLGAEVLASQPPDVLRFLLLTSVLDRFCGELCEAVTGAEGAVAMLDRLERANLFLVPLDDHRGWYRYHRLFTALLRHELAGTYPREITALHRRACDWYARAGWYPEAIEHAFAAGDVPAAVDLVAGRWRDTFNAGGLATVSGWLDRLPSVVVDGDARLCHARAWVAMDRGQLDEVARWLAKAERAVATGRPADAATGAAMAILHAVHRFKSGEVRRAHAAARQALDLERSDAFARTVAHLLTGITGYWRRDQTATGALEQAARSARDQDNYLASVYAHGYLALLRADAGASDDAERDAREAIGLADDPRRREHFVGAIAYLALGMVEQARGRLPAAAASMDRALELSSHGAGRVEVAAVLVGRARLALTAGDRERAADLLDRAGDVVAACPDPGWLASLHSATARKIRPPAAVPVATAETRPILTDRELAVLQLLARDLTRREISAALFVSLNTVKTHLRNINRKLGAATSDDVIRRARELQLI